MKYAYLIIANRNYTQLQTLINMLDDSRNDIYLIIDKRSKDLKYNFHTNFSTLNYVKPLKIYWGNYSIVEAELKLFEAAVPNHYTYYHLLSGFDLPLVNQDKVHSFFDQHLNKEFIGYGNYTNRKKMNNDIYIRIKHHFFRKHYKSTNFIEKAYRYIERRMLKYFFYCKIPKYRIGYASQWVSVDDKLAQLIVKYHKWIENIFKYSICPDEIFIPTLMNYHSKFVKKVFYNDSYNKDREFTGNLRFINFRNSYSASPNVWTLDDYSKLLMARRNNYLFSRKFDSNIDNNIIKKVFNLVMTK